MPIYALKVDEGWPWLIHQSLKRGEGRFGWSYVESANLHDLRDRIAADGWSSLDTEEKDCYQELLLSLNCGDYVVYINLPEWGPSNSHGRRGFRPPLLLRRCDRVPHDFSGGEFRF